MVARAHAEETGKGRDGIGYAAGGLVDHEIVHRAEMLSLAIIGGRAFVLVGGDEAIRLFDRGPAGRAVPAREVRNDAP
jgi:hypothetical protein